MAQLEVLNWWGRYWVNFLKLVWFWNKLQLQRFIEFCPNWRSSSAIFNLFLASITSFRAFPYSVSISSSFFISINLICLSNFSSACNANMLAFCFSSNNFSNDLELVEDLTHLDELWGFELLLDFRDLEDMDSFGLLSFDLELRWVLLFSGFDRICRSKGFFKISFV